MHVIGLTGPAGCGKDTVAGFILDEVEGAKRQGFADALKLSAARIFYPTMDLEGALDFCNWLKTRGGVQVLDEPNGREPVSDISGRQFLQRYGTEAHRDVFGEDFWLDAVLYNGRCDCPLLVIPDVRFPNEAKRVLARGGELWRVYRPGTEPVEAHVSEAGIPDDFHARVIQNTGTLEQLQLQVQSALDAFRRKHA